VSLKRKNRIQQRDQIEALGDIEEGGDIAEGSDLGMEGWGRLAGFLGSGDEVLQLAEVDGANDFGLAVHALCVAGVVVGMAVDDLRGQAWHI
jgi:hypothetical protein